MKAETMRRHVPHEVDAAALPGGRESLGDGRLQALMCIGDDKFDAAHAAPGELAQELRPDRLCLGCADLHAQHLASAVGVDADGDDDGNGDDAAAAADPQVGGVYPQIRPAAFDRPFEEGLHLAVDLLAQPQHLGACPSTILDGALTGWFDPVMSKRFRSWDVDQGWLVPASVHDFVAPDHLAHFVRDTVREGLDLSPSLTLMTRSAGICPIIPA